MNQIRLFIFLFISITLFSGALDNNKIKDLVFDKLDSTGIRTGLRASPYGPQVKFPSADYWVSTVLAMSNYFKKSTPSIIWIIGTMDWDNQKNTYSGKCFLDFPKPKNDPKVYGNILFSSKDKSESYLKGFDKNNIKVWLQVEPANANIPDLIKLILTQYSNHPSVIGFGIDAEWYQWSEKNNEGVAITNPQAKQWAELVREYNKDYLIFFKHWLPSKMPQSYKQGVVFVDDSQIFNSLNAIVSEFKSWANWFYPAKVAFQFGYESDKKWWIKYTNPPKTISDELIKSIPNLVGLYWVDFTMEDIWPHK